MIYDKTPINEAEPLTKEKYEPCCGTPLFDAIGKSVASLKKHLADTDNHAVLVTIITDGYENAAEEYYKKN